MSTLAISEGRLGADFGLIALRTRRLARAVIVVGSLSLVVMNALPMTVALVLPAPAVPHTLASLSVPTFRFPVLDTKVAFPSRPTVAPAPAHLLRIVPARRIRLAIPSTKPIGTTRRVRVPVVSSSHGLTQSQSTQHVKPIPKTLPQPPPVAVASSASPAAVASPASPAARVYDARLATIVRLSAKLVRGRQRLQTELQ